MKHLIIADDLTGANSASVLLKQSGLTAMTYLDRTVFNDELECCVYSSDSRGIVKEEAYNRVFAMTRLFRSDKIQLYSKRIDSTMRGNIGSEIDAMLEALDNETIVLCTPSYPDSGRVVRKGILYVDGIALCRSEVIKESLSDEMRCSSVKEIISKQSKYKISNIYSDDYYKGFGYLISRIQEKIKKGYRIIVFDADCNEEIKIIAELAIHLKNIVLADSGMLTYEVAKRKFKTISGIRAEKILAVVGSINYAVHKQIERLKKSKIKTEYVVVNVQKLLSDGRQSEVDRILSLVKETKGNSEVVVVFSDGVLGKKIENLTEKKRKIINQQFGVITEKIISDSDEFGGIYISGGDTATAVCEQLEVKGINPIKEIIPLAVYGKLIGGKYNGYRIITKGGSQGDEKALVDCMKCLLEVLRKGKGYE